jgi:hypothetical protein
MKKVSGASRAGLQGTNALAYLASAPLPQVNVIKTFFFFPYEEAKLARAFVPRQTFQHRLTFLS